MQFKGFLATGASPLAIAICTLAMNAGTAQAQSSGTVAIEEIVVSARKLDIGGAMIAEVVPKSRVSIDAEMLSRQSPGQTLLDSINLMPSVNFSNNDAFGNAGGDITVRGFDSQRVALLQDGIPLNDSGNYAIYPNQQLEPDLIEKVSVNLGTTDVDSPTAAAAGGSINYITRAASHDMGARAEVGFGSDGFQRYYGTLETGDIGTSGPRAWFSGLFTTNKIFKPWDAQAKPAGKIQKMQLNFRVDQDISSYGKISVIGDYNQNRNSFINRITLAQFNARSVPVYNAQGAAENINPSNTGNVRVLSTWDLSDQLTLTVDPSFQYTLANGGGAANWAESDPQIRGNTTSAGVDLNGDGDTLDSVRLYRPNITQTRRVGVTSSLIYKFADMHSFRVAYTYDRARHRQTGEVGFFRADFYPEDVFAGKSAGFGGRSVKLPDGTLLRRRDRASVALLNQVAAEYRGRFFEEKVLVNVGVRAPYFTRHLNNFCYQRDTFNAYCTTQAGTPVAGTNDGTGRTFVTFPVAALNTSAAFLYGRPRSFDRKYNKLLPNVGVSYDITSDWSVYASYAETLSAPRTDDLYDQVLIDPGPEVAHAYDVGTRYQSGSFMISGALWANDFSNRIERVLDEAAGIAFSANVGNVKLWGIDGQLGYKPVERLSIYASASYIQSEIQADIKNTTVGALLPTKGKSLYETPEFQSAVRVQYDATDWLAVGVQGKYTGARWTNLVNTERAPSYTLVDLDARIKLDERLKNTYVQLNIRNLFDKRFLGDITTNLVGTAQFQPGYRRTFMATVHAEF